MIGRWLLCLCVIAGMASAQNATPPTIGTTVPATSSTPGAATSSPQGAGAGSATSKAAPAQGPSLNLTLTGGTADKNNLGSALEIVLLMTLLSLAPAIVLTMTCFTRIIIVLSFLKRAMAMQELPPAMVVTGFAVFLSIFIMRPVIGDVYDQAYKPYTAGEIDFEEALDRAGGRMNKFMLRQTRPQDIQLVVDLSESERPRSPADVPLHVTVPAFILSEMKTAFQMGFVLFLPFIVIDLVTAALLVSMGMFTLPPIVISTPLKLLLFIMVDGWNLVVSSLAASFTPS